MQLFKDSLKSLTDPIKGIVNVLLPREEPKNELSDFIFIYPRIFWMSFPSKEKIRDLADSLNTQFDRSNYFVWNLSEHKYNAKYFRNQVTDLCFPGYPCPSMQYLLLICKSILEWLSGDKNNVAFIHCQANKGRSAVLIACLLTLLKVVNHPMEALAYFCNKLNLKDTEFLFPSQHLYIRNFASLLDNIKINTKTYILEKIIINEVPKFLEEEDKNVYISDQKLLEEETFKPYIQIFEGNNLVYNFLKEHNPMEYNRNDRAIVFEVGIEITDDVLIRCRHFRSEYERISFFRLMFSPFFAFDEVVRLYSRDIDFAPEFETSNSFFVDLVLKPKDDNNEEAKVLNQLKDDCIKLAREHRQKRDQLAKSIRQAKNEAARAMKSPEKKNQPNQPEITRAPVGNTKETSYTFQQQVGEAIEKHEGKNIEKIKEDVVENKKSDIISQTTEQTVEEEASLKIEKKDIDQEKNSEASS